MENPKAPQQDFPSLTIPWEVVRWLLAAWLFTAAALKLWAYFNDPVSLPPIPLTKLAWPILIGAELLWAAALVFGNRRRRRFLYLATVAGFTLLASVAVWFTFLRLPSCGCFGSLHVPPWATAIVDCLVVISLRFCRPREAALPTWRSGVLVGTALGAAVVALLAATAPTRLSGETPLPSEGGFVVVEPVDWPGKRLALLEFIESETALSEGRWRLLLVHHDCPKCAAVVARLAEESPSDSAIAVVQVPPHGAWSKAIPERWRRARLSDRFEWYVATPLAIEIDDGVVTRVVEREGHFAE